jgi:hypothetical protein
LIGLLLCASRNDEVAEYALSSTLSPALIAGEIPRRVPLGEDVYEGARV